MMKAAVCGVAVLVLGIVIVAEAKVFDRCEFAAELQRLGARDDMLADWVCLAEKQSNYTTSASMVTVWTGTHGIFGISDAFWCDRSASIRRRIRNYNAPNICKVSCEDLVDDDIADDFACANKIFNAHGFHAWNPWAVKCWQFDVAVYLDDCIEDKLIKPLTFTDDEDDDLPPGGVN
ncbi:PREDICTED: lysozyme C-1-like [Priapulus caudatus]|uniref:lysozyme n=1 Tax=Priapulus caudatus TaxID=37621 RepID=A0ABM1E9S9_PRICU|nr:PREDICTED: lysozyme C-1-like [Priapulus caudatus]